MPRQSRTNKTSDEEIQELIEAFKYFDHTTTALNQAYRKLELKIDDLRSELEEKNSLLSHSLAETNRVKNFLSKILENMSSGVVVIDREGRITLFNKMAGVITGFPPESVEGKDYCRIMGMASDPKFSLLHTLQTAEALYKKEKTITSSKQSIFTNNNHPFLYLYISY